MSQNLPKTGENQLFDTQKCVEKSIKVNHCNKAFLMSINSCFSINVLSSRYMGCERGKGKPRLTPKLQY